jgi:ribonuclease J
MYSQVTQRLPDALALPHIPHPADDAITAIPLGGCARIGMNATLYGTQGRWILVDAGSAFPEDKHSRIQALLPDLEILEALSDRLEALIVTHAHEDHIGAIQRLWPRLRCPIYATHFAAALLEIQLEENRLKTKVQIQHYSPGEHLRLGPFDVETVPMSHSVPESTALCLEASGVRVVHSGDWKMDQTPLLGRPTDLARLHALGALGVDALFCDSTNADKAGCAGSEVHVALGIAAVCREAKGMVVVAGFSSHLARMAGAAAAAVRDGRHVGFTGRSMARVVKAGARAGYVSNPKAFLDLPSLAKVPARHRMLLATGAQGEKSGGLDRLLAGQLSVHLGRGDILVLAARTIPGNERPVERICARARAVGARVVRNDETFGPNAWPVHVSGHAYQDDLAALYAALRPRALVPVHGSPDHIAAHAAFGASRGIASVLPPVDGQIIEVRRDGIRIAGGIALRAWAWDGRRIRLA